MSFASLVFFIFLPVVFALHWLVPQRRWQNGVLLLASYVFYGWWDWRFCFLMLASSLIDYWAGLEIDRVGAPKNRKRILAAALSCNLLILGFFKYCNFFADSLAATLAIAGLDLPAWSWTIVLPVGISFYTFQTMSYTLDVYFRRFRPLRNLLDYLTFVSFFPQLVAGPIERATDLLPQFHRLRFFAPAEAREGCRFILWGLAKKMLVADNLAGLVNSAYNSPKGASGAQLFLATICFAFQIYCDFSGYSDIAVGVARLFGIKLMRNFAYPYFAQSITEFWRRWHISLSTWFRDYVYIPLGGNRVSRAKHARNLLVVALLSGLWHGAAWHFVVWGALHGFYLAGEKLLGPRAGRSTGPAFSRPAHQAPGGESFLPDWRILARLARTFFLVCLAWIFFRADTLDDAGLICFKIFSQAAQPAFYGELGRLAREQASTLALLGLFLFVEWCGRKSWNPFALGERPLLLRWAAYSALFWLILLYGTGQTQEFIYFRF